MLHLSKSLILLINVLPGMHFDLYCLLFDHRHRVPWQRCRFPSFRLTFADGVQKAEALLSSASLEKDRSPVRQITLDKNMNFLFTTASFTVAIKSHRPKVSFTFSPRLI